MTDHTTTAFPVTEESVTAGMTLRDYFAAKAMQSILTSPVPPVTTASKFKGLTVVEYVSTQAYEIADEMMKARGE